MTALAIILIVIFGGLFYMLPSIIAVVKNHEYKLPILLLNIFLGGTAIGWLGALVWAIWFDE